MLLQKVLSEEKILLEKGAVVEYLEKEKPEVLITLGAGDIDRLVEPIREKFSFKNVDK